MLAVDGIEAGYGDAPVLQAVSFAVRAGEVVALLGRNGAGKTTSMRCIVGIVRPRAGTITFDGEDVTGLRSHVIARRGISFVPDDRRIFPDLTVEENLEIARRAAKRTGDWDVDRVYELFPVLSDYRARGGLKLSGGEQKMLATGRALVQNPKLLLMDEASEGLAPKVVDTFVKAIREISATGITVLLADQNLKFARKVADRGYIMDKGRIEHADEMEAIWADERIVRRYLSV
jgi:branched-chain amino acid transport system ATP-binding protein